MSATDVKTENGAEPDTAQLPDVISSEVASTPLSSSWSRAVERSRRGGWFSVLTVLLGLLFAALVIYPLVRVLLQIFFVNGKFDFSIAQEVLAYPDLGQVLLNTVILVASSMVLALFFGALFAWLMERTDARIGRLAALMPMLPMLMPPIAGAIGWVFLLAPQSGFINAIIRAVLDFFGLHLTTGPLNIYSWAGLIALYTAYQIPFAFLMITTGLRNSDSSMEEASRISGASLGKTLRRITIPVLRPSLGAAALYMVWFGFSFYSVPVVLGTQMNVKVLPVEIVKLLTFTFPANTQVAVGLSIFLVIAIGTAWYFQGRILRNNRHSSIGGKGQRNSVTALGKWRRPAQALLVLYFSLTFVLPLLAQALVALNGYWTTTIKWASLDITRLWTGITANSEALTAFGTSSLLGVVGATIGITLAAIFALYLREHRSRLSRALDGIIKLPAALSAIVVGLGFILAFAGPPFNLGNTIAILLLCYLVLFLPQATIAADAAAAQVDRQLSEASWVSGAGNARTFARINIPLMLPGLVAGWGLLFVWMTGELNASVMLAGTQTPVVGYYILQTFQYGGFATLASLAFGLTLLNIVVLTIAHFIEKRTTARSS
ncbi:MAG: iron ABC transporter permease [Actinomycetota bacterium]